MRFILLGNLIFVFCACNGQIHDKRIEYVKSYDYKITVNIGPSFWDLGIRYILDNSSIDRYDSSDERNRRFRPLILYYISMAKEPDVNNASVQNFFPIDTFEIRFSKENSDKLFNLTKNFFEALTFNNIDTLLNGSKTELVVDDDASAFVEIDFRGRKLYASISSISNPSISTKEFDELLTFIQKFKPELK